MGQKNYPFPRNMNNGGILKQPGRPGRSQDDLLASLAIRANQAKRLSLQPQAIPVIPAIPMAGVAMACGCSGKIIFNTEPVDATGTDGRTVQSCPPGSVITDFEWEYCPTHPIQLGQVRMDVWAALLSQMQVVVQHMFRKMQTVVQAAKERVEIPRGV